MKVNCTIHVDISQIEDLNETNISIVNNYTNNNSTNHEHFNAIKSIASKTPKDSNFLFNYMKNIHDYIEKVETESGYRDMIANWKED